EREELLQEVLPDPVAELLRFLIRQRLHHLHEERLRDRDHPELVRVDVPLDETPDRLVHEEVDADPLAVRELSKELVDVPLDPNCSRDARARGQVLKLPWNPRTGGNAASLNPFFDPPEPQNDLILRFF